MTAVEQNTLDLKKVRISPLIQKESIKRFSCGVSEIDSWFKSKAFKWNAQDRSRVFIAHLDGNENALGYYCLSLSTEDSRKLSDSNSRDKYPQGFPIMYLHYIAVSKTAQRMGLGTLMLLDALKRANFVSQHVAFFGVGLRSLNDDTTRLYERYGFGIAPDEDKHPLMILPIWTIRELFNK